MTSYSRMPLPIIVLSLFGAMVTSSPVSQYSYKTVSFTDFPPNMEYHGQPRSVHNLMHCTTFCARDPHCKAVYLKEDSDGKLMCHLYSQNVADIHFLSPGTGTYAYFASFDTTDIPQTLAVASLMYIEWYQPMETIVAVYSFSAISDWTTLGVLFDRDTNQFPRLSSNCAMTMYQALGLSSTIVRIVEEIPGSFYRLHVTCPDGETKHSDAECDSSGQWSLDTNLGVACVSEDCYRVSQDSAGYARYSGTKKNTVWGTGCSAWSNYQWYSDSSFPHDMYSKSVAQNYCRDPNGRSRPWCKIGSYYDYCDVPKCNWQP